MKLEHKSGIAISSIFLCLVGAVIGLKMQEKPPESSIAAANDAFDPPVPVHKSEDPASFDDMRKSPPGAAPRSPAPKENARNSAPRQTLLPPDVDKSMSFLGGDPRQKGDKKEQSSSGLSASQSREAKERATVPAPTPPPTNSVTLDDVQSVLNGKAKPTTASQREQKAHLLEVEGDRWKISSDTSRDRKPDAMPTAPGLGTNPPPPAPFTPESKNTPPPSRPTTSVILPASTMEPMIDSPDSKVKPIPSPTTPATPRPANAASQTSSPSNGSTPGASSLTFGTPSYLLEQPTNAPNVPTPKGKETTSPPPQSLGKQSEPQTSSLLSAPPPPSWVNPPTAPPSTPPTTLPPTKPPSTAMPPVAPLTTTTPPSTKLPEPFPLPVSISSQPPAPPSPPPPPPQPPANGSTFIPDPSASASAPTGVKPAQLPLPTLPSSPLTSMRDKATLPRPAGTGASVMVYDEQDYSCQGKDTWEEISKRFYMTDRYAKALQRHNQNHARASDRMREAGQVAPGERVFVPQAYILEDRYADAIPRPTAASPGTTMPTVYTPNNSPPPRP